MVDGGGGASDLLVIFGITGDLARKMTFRALYRLERHQLLDCPILGVASDDMSVGQLVKWARESIGRTEKIDDAVFDRLAGRLSYLHGDVTDSQLYDSLAELIGSACRPLYYLEMPPALFAPIVENLANVRLLERARVAVESRSATTWPPRSNSTPGCERCWAKTKSCVWTTFWASSPSSSWST